jgi:hypothetical protein
MAIDLEAIRRKVQELSGGRRQSSIQLWKPAIGEYKIRCLPWKNSPEGSPFIERWFYYIGNNRGILTPKQFGKEDPVDTLITSLFRSGKPDDRVLAKKLLAKMRVYTPVVVRGEEDRGVLVWSFGKLVYQRLLSFFIDEEVGNILDPEEGYDLKVTISQQAGKQFMDTVVDAARKPSKLHADPTQVKAWLDAVPNIDDMYPLKSAQEIEAVLNSWLNGENEDSDGASRGGSNTDDALAKLEEEISSPKASSPAAVLDAETDGRQADAPKRKRTKVSTDVDAPAVRTQTLDEALDDVMGGG